MQCYFCHIATDIVVSLDRKPLGETDYGVTPYHRDISRCRLCGHGLNHSSYTPDYTGEYRTYTYGSSLSDVYHRVMSLPKEKSDNMHRVDSVCTSFEHWCPHGDRTLLDIGSGLGVFPIVMHNKGWNVVAVDSDIYVVEEHLRHYLPIVWHGFLESLLENPYLVPHSFPLVSVVKVLEHVRDPIFCLRQAVHYLRFDGVLYGELPDGDTAFAEGGAHRQETFIEHLHIFSFRSIHLLAEAAGLRCLSIEKITEPSGKYTYRFWMSF